MWHIPAPTGKACGHAKASHDVCCQRPMRNQTRPKRHQVKEDQTTEWLDIIERIMVINLKGRRKEDMPELMQLLERLETLNQQANPDKGE